MTEAQWTRGGEGSCRNEEDERKQTDRPLENCPTCRKAAARLQRDTCGDRSAACPAAEVLQDSLQEAGLCERPFPRSGEQGKMRLEDGGQCDGDDDDGDFSSSCLVKPELNLSSPQTVTLTSHIWDIRVTDQNKREKTQNLYVH